MYTLRTVSDLNGNQNHGLGKFYGSVNRFENPERFRELFKEMFKRHHVEDLEPSSDEDTRTTIGFVIGENDYIIPIDKRNDNYIMTDEGTTFERLNKAMLRQAPALEGLEYPGVESDSVKAN